MASADIRFERNAQRTEAARKELLASAVDADIDDSVMFVEISGGVYGDEARKFWGAYQKIEASGGAVEVYQKLKPDGGICGFQDHGPFLVLGKGKKEGDDNRWRITNSPDSTKSFAQNTERGVTCPTKLQKPWKVYMRDQREYCEEAGLTVTEIPIGFFPVSHEKPRAERAGPVHIKDGPAKGTIVEAKPEHDASQPRGLSPRCWTKLPDGQVFRGEWKKILIIMGEAATSAIRDVYQEQLQPELTKKLNAYVHFTLNKPITLYVSVDETHFLLAASAFSMHKNQRIRRIPVPSDDLEPLPVDFEELDLGDPIEPDAKKPKLLDDSFSIGGSKDPFLKSIARGLDPPKARQADSTQGNQDATVKKSPPDVSPLSHDFHALRRNDKRVRARILEEAQWRPWHRDFLDEGKLRADTEEEIDEIWLYSIAVSQDDKQPPLNPCELLKKLTQVTCQFVSNSLRPVLGRLLGVLNCLRKEAFPQRPLHAPTTLDILDVALTMIALGWVSDTLEDQHGGLKKVQLLFKLNMKRKAAELVFKPDSRLHSSGSLAVALSFGALLTCHLDSTTQKSAVQKVENLLYLPGQAPALWLLVVNLFLGLVWHITGESSVEDALDRFLEAACSEEARKVLVQERHDYHITRRLPDEPPSTAAEEVSAVSDSVENSAASEKLAELSNVVPDTPLSHMTDVQADMSIHTTPPDVQVQAVKRSKKLEVDSVGTRPDAESLETHCEGRPALGTEAKLGNQSWFESAVTALDGVSVRFRVPTETSNRDRYYSLVSAYANDPDIRPSNRVQMSVADAIAVAPQEPWHMVVLPYIQCADLFRAEVANEHDRRDDLLRAFHIYNACLKVTDTMDDIVKAAVFVRRAQALHALDELDASQPGKERSRAAQVENHVGVARGLLHEMSMDRFSEHLMSAWGLVPTPTTSAAVGVRAATDGSQQQAEHGTSQAETQQPTAVASTSDPAPSRPPPADAAPHRHSPSDPSPKVSASAAEHVISSKQDESRGADTKGSRERRGCTEARPGAASQTDAAASLASRAIGQTSSSPSLASAATGIAKPAVVFVDIATLLAGHVPQVPWHLQARVAYRKAFITSCPGFFAVLEDDLNKDIRIMAFFFNAASRAHEAAVRTGVRLHVVAVSSKTYLKRQHSDSDLQLVVGVDAQITAALFTLRRLPLSGTVELFAVVAKADGERSDKYARPFHLFDLVDETMPGPGIRWFVFSPQSLHVPRNISRGSVVHIMGAYLEFTRGRRSLRNGSMKFYACGAVGMPERCGELRTWFQNC